MSVKCPGCGLDVGTYANGKIRPHFGRGTAALCPGSYTMHEVST